MYHMFEVYNEIGASEIIAVDIVSGIASFFVVALGGTIIGEYLAMFFFKSLATVNTQCHVSLMVVCAGLYIPPFFILQVSSGAS